MTTSIEIIKDVVMAAGYELLSLYEKKKITIKCPNDHISSVLDSVIDFVNISNTEMLSNIIDVTM